MQKGNLRRVGNSWVLRYNVREQVDGKTVWRGKAAVIAKRDPANNRFLYIEDVEPLAESFLRSINAETAMRAPAGSAELLADFLKMYLAHCRTALKPSSTAGYECQFRLVEPHLGELTLNSTYTPDVQRILEAVARTKARSHNSHKNVKRFLSSAFRWAIQTGRLTRNPVTDARIPRGKAAKETSAYTLAQIQEMLAVLTEPARTLVLTAALTGLRASELRGLQWTDFTGDTLQVQRGVWQSHVTDTKTLSSKAGVPVLPVLRAALEAHKARNGFNGWCFHNAAGHPLDLKNLVDRRIRPALEAAGLEWHGWHAFRRGLGSNLHELGVEAHQERRFQPQKRTQTGFRYPKP